MKIEKNIKAPELSDEDKEYALKLANDFEIPSDKMESYIRHLQYRINEAFKLRRSAPSQDPRFLVLTTVGQSNLGLLVEELLGEQDVVIKPLGEHVFESRGLAGSTILGDGAIALVLDVTEIIEDVIATHRQFAPHGAWQARTVGQFEENQARNI